MTSARYLDACEVSIVFNGRGKLFVRHNSMSCAWIIFKSNVWSILSLNLTILIKIRFYLGLSILAAMLFEWR